MEKVDAIGEGYADKGVEIAGVAAEHLIQHHTAKCVEIHQTVVRVDCAEIHDFTLTNGRVEHDTCTLVKVYDIDLFLEKNLFVIKASNSQPIVASASKQRNRETLFPLSYSPMADSTLEEYHPKAHIRCDSGHSV